MAVKAKTLHVSMLMFMCSDPATTTVNRFPRSTLTRALTVGLFSCFVNFQTPTKDLRMKVSLPGRGKMKRNRYFVYSTTVTHFVTKSI